MFVSMRLQVTVMFHFMALRTKRPRSTKDTDTSRSYYNIVVEYDEQKKYLNKIRHKNILMSRSVFLLILEEIDIANEHGNSE